MIDLESSLDDLPLARKDRFVWGHNKAHPLGLTYVADSSSLASNPHVEGPGLECTRYVQRR
jgi:hypothetical protein